MSLKNALSCLFRRTNNVAETNEIDLMDYSHKNILIDLKILNRCIHILFARWRLLLLLRRDVGSANLHFQATRTWRTLLCDRLWQFTTIGSTYYVVRTSCCKGDNKNQWRSPKLDQSGPYGETLNWESQKLVEVITSSSSPIPRKFFFIKVALRRIKVHQAISWFWEDEMGWGSSISLQLRPVNRYTFGVAKNKY